MFIRFGIHYWHVTDGQTDTGRKDIHTIVSFFLFHLFIIFYYYISFYHFSEYR